MSNNENRSFVSMFFNVDLHVVSVWFALIYLVQFSLEQENLKGRDATADAGDAEHHREEYCKQVPQHIDKKSESDEQQPYNEKSGCEVSGGLRNCV